MTKAKTLAEWQEFYEKKTGDKPANHKGCRLFYLAERGYALIKADEEGKMIIVFETCGDGKFWHDIAEMLAMSSNYYCISTMCIRNIKAYIRAFGWTIERAWHCLNSKTKKVEDRYLCRDSQNRPVVITLAGYDETDTIPHYWVTHYLNTQKPPELNLSANAIELTKEAIEEMESVKHYE